MKTTRVKAHSRNINIHKTAYEYHKQEERKMKHQTTLIQQMHDLEKKLNELSYGDIGSESVEAGIHLLKAKDEVKEAITQYEADTREE